MVRRIRLTEKLLGEPAKTVLACEKPVQAAARRSIAAAHYLEKGHILGLDDLVLAAAGGRAKARAGRLACGQEAQAEYCQRRNDSAGGCGIIMCGIAGYLGPLTISKDRVRMCLGLMGRRGPDFCDAYRHSRGPDRNVLLLHSRLSIIDLDLRAHQPYHHGSKVLAYNGELYNYLELKPELGPEPFVTTSDTEVLIRGLDQNGPGFLDRCEGMWAFALYDEADGSLLLSRDRFGEKPLYYFSDHTGFYFASEVKFLFALLGRKLPVNRDQIRRYLVNGYKTLYKGPDTFFEGLQEVQPAHNLRLPAAGASEERAYWSPVCGIEHEMSFAEAVAGARERLIQAVKIRLRADVPLAFCMSGGIDSNALISIAKNVFDFDVHGFTIVNTDERYDEWNLVELAVKEQGLKHTAIPIRTDNFLPRLRELIRYHDAPVYTITYFAHWLLQEAIAQHGYKISLSGTAADELFTGYFDHHNFYLHEMRKGGDRFFQQALDNWRRDIGAIVRNPYLKDPGHIMENPDFRGHIYLNNDQFAAYIPGYKPESFREENYCGVVLRNRMLNELFHESVPVILHEDDLNAMYYSIENRSPFLDRNLFEFSQSIPTRHLIHDGRAKAVLREALRGIAPDPILDNPRKVGFNAPIFDFLDIRDPEARSLLLDDGPLFEIVDRSKVESLLAKDQLPNSESKFLFYFLGCKIFLEEFAS